MHHRASLPLCVVFSLVLLLESSARAQDPRAVELGRTLTLAEQLERQGKGDEAIAQYAKSRTLAEALFGSNSVNVAALLQAEALLHRQKGNYALAESHIVQALKIARAAGDRSFVAEALNNLAAVKWAQAAYSNAQDLHEEALALMIEQYGDNSPEAAISRGNLAGVYKALGEYSQAEPLFLRSIKVLRRHQPSRALELADGLMNLADLYTAEGEFPRSEMLLLEAMQIKEQRFGRNHYEVGRTLNNLAAHYSTIGQYKKAEEMQKRSLAILESTLGAEHVDVARALINLAVDYQRQKRFAEAEPLYKRSLSIRERALGVDHPDTALAKHNLGGFYSETRDYAQALAYYDQALAIRRASLGANHPTVAYTLMAMGEIHFRQGHFESAEKSFQEALEIREAKLSDNHPDLAYTRSALGQIQAATDRWESSVEHFDRARRSFRAHVDQVLPSLSEADQLTFLKHVDEPHYHAALSLVLSQPHDEEVVGRSANWALNGKAVAQQALSQRALVARDTNNPQLAALVKSLLFIRKQLASLTMTSNLDEAETRRQARIDELSRQEQEHAQLLARQGGRSLGASTWIENEQVRQALKPDSVLVEISRFRFHDTSAPDADIDQLTEHYVAWIIPPAGPSQIRAIVLGEAADIDERVRAARASLQVAPAAIRDFGEPDAEKALAPVLKDLGGAVLQPLLPHVEAAKTIYLSPDSLLWLVPWNALLLPSEKYAIEEFDIRLLVTGRDLCRADARPEAGQLVVFADPDYNLDPTEGESFARAVLGKPTTGIPLRAVAPTGKFKLGTVTRLPGTKAEAEAVLPNLESFGGAKATIYSQQYALEAIFKELRQPRVLMLSTHGFFEEQEDAEVAVGTADLPATNPLLRCGLLLAGCNKPGNTVTGELEDGILTGLEIVSADLRGTDLVVLSACETGLGEVRNGEGVAGLRQAFQLAGARAIVSTLWQIPDRDTAKLMANFFASLAESGEKGSALRQSQLKLIASRRDRGAAAHPFFWAAFTLTGE